LWQEGVTTTHLGDPNVVGNLVPNPEIKLSYGPNGNFRVRAVGTETGPSETVYCYSQYITVLVMSNIAQLQFKGLSSSTSRTIAQAMTMTTLYEFTLIVKNAGGGLIKGQTVEINYNLLQGPQYVVSDMLYPESKYITFE